MTARRPWYRVLLCCLGWHCVEHIGGDKMRCVYCETWDYADEWIGP